jgi:hypothetical protein
MFLGLKEIKHLKNAFLLFFATTKFKAFENYVLTINADSNFLCKKLTKIVNY